MFVLDKTPKLQRFNIYYQKCKENKVEKVKEKSWQQNINGVFNFQIITDGRSSHVINNY